MACVSYNMKVSDKLIIMREIKFRAWGSQGQGMFPVTDIDFQDMSVNRGLTSCVLMQYTGLKDKNGVEIYESDIIRYKESEEINHWVSGEIALVVWQTPRFTFRMKPYNKFDGVNQNIPTEDDCEFIEVIGDIYQHPELLK